MAVPAASIQYSKGSYGRAPVTPVVERLIRSNMLTKGGAVLAYTHGQDTISHHRAAYKRKKGTSAGLIKENAKNGSKNWIIAPRLIVGTS